jgi:hypothetical protein
MSDLDKAYYLSGEFVITKAHGEMFDEIVELIVKDTLDKAAQRVAELPYWFSRDSCISEIKKKP